MSGRLRRAWAAALWGLGPATALAAPPAPMALWAAGAAAVAVAPGPPTTPPLPPPPAPLPRPPGPTPTPPLPRPPSPRPQAEGPPTAPAADPEALPFVAVLVPPAVPLQVGATQPVALTVRPRAPWALRRSTPLTAHLQVEGPLQVAPEALSEAHLEALDAATWQLTARVGGVAAGRGTLHCALDLFLCQSQVCQRYRQALSLPLQVAVSGTAPP